MNVIFSYVFTRFAFIVKNLLEKYSRDYYINFLRIVQIICNVYYVVLTFKFISGNFKHEKDYRINKIYVFI